MTHDRGVSSSTWPCIGKTPNPKTLHGMQGQVLLLTPGWCLWWWWWWWWVGSGAWWWVGGRGDGGGGGRWLVTGQCSPILRCETQICRISCAADDLSELLSKVRRSSGCGGASPGSEGLSKPSSGINTPVAVGTPTFQRRSSIKMDGQVGRGGRREGPLAAGAGRGLNGCMLLHEIMGS